MNSVSFLQRPALAGAALFGAACAGLLRRPPPPFPAGRCASSFLSAAGNSPLIRPRVISPRRSPTIGKQPVRWDNRAGANGFIALQYLLTAGPDGYTFTIGTGNTTHAANSALFKKAALRPCG